MNKDFQYGDELSAEMAGLLLPHLAEQLAYYSTCNRWFYAKDGAIFSLHEESQTLILLTADSNDIEDAHFLKADGYQVSGDVCYDLHGGIVSYIARNAMEVIKEFSLLNCPEVKKAQAEVAIVSEENGLELF